MSDTTPLTEEQIAKAMPDLPGWSYDNDSLQKTFVFNSFKEALSFIVRLGLHAEEQQHHPNIQNVYNKVIITLSTHDAGDKVTAKDHQLAKTIEKFNWTENTNL